MHIRITRLGAASLVLVASLAGCQSGSQTANADRYRDDPSYSASNPRDSTIPNTAIGARNNQGTTSREREPGAGVAVPLG
jgi:hypothetical protein